MNNVFQIYISDDGVIPPKLKACQQTVLDAAQQHAYALYDGPRLEQMLHEHFPSEVLWAFRKLAPYSYKSDLGRFCLLYLYGGWYLDMAIRMHRQFPGTGSKVEGVFFKDAFRPGQHVWETSTGLIYARKGSKVMACAIDMILENCRTGYYGSTNLDPTGPGLLGRALTQCGTNANCITGNYLPLTPQHGFKNPAFVLPSGEILAWGKATHGTEDWNGLQSFGAQGTNSYADMYQAKAIYLAD